MHVYGVNLDLYLARFGCEEVLFYLFIYFWNHVTSV